MTKSKYKNYNQEGKFVCLFCQTGTSYKFTWKCLKRLSKLVNIAPSITHYIKIKGYPRNNPFIF
jgi:hypothetical protein